MIEFHNLGKDFGEKTVLHSVSGKLHASKVNLVIGASGTGKSVLVKCLVGLIVPSRGSLVFDGRDFFQGGKKAKTAIRRELGMLFQGSALFDSKTVEENVMFPLNILTDMPLEEKLERVNFCLKRVGLTNINQKMPSEISGGMKKRVGIARAIVNKPKYLFCDEPNSGLDPRTGLLIDELIQEITYEYGMITTVITHDMNSVVSMGDHIIFMDKGNKVWEGTSEDIFEVDIPALQDFLFAGKLMKMAQKGIQRSHKIR